MSNLPTDAKSRKEVPIYSGCIRYFPDALAEVARLSKVGNDQHNPGQPLHWDRSKSTDELDALTRHLFEAGTLDTDGMRHSAKVAWRALANLQKELEAEHAGLAKSDPDGWIPWSGGDCPVLDDTEVDIERINGSHLLRRPAGTFNWQHLGIGTDITAYRIAS